MSTALVRYDAACRAVMEAKSLDEARSIRDKAEAMRAYARQAKNKQLEIDASEIRFRAERRIGELMEAQRNSVGLAKAGRPPKIGVKETPISLEEAGIDKNLAKRARSYAAVPGEKFEAMLEERRENIEAENQRVTVNLLEASKVRGTQGTGENEWYTPGEYIELARKVLGEIDLDPASSEHAQKVVGASKFFTRDDDGLAKEWHGRIWLNPPYAQPEIGYFAEKMCEEVDAGRITEAVMLTHNYTDTTWFQGLAKFSSAICFTRGRIRFVSPDGDLAAPTQGQAFFYFGRNVEGFRSIFEEVGIVVQRLQSDEMGLRKEGMLQSTAPPEDRSSGGMSAKSDRLRGHRRSGGDQLAHADAGMEVGARHDSDGAAPNASTHDDGISNDGLLRSGRRGAHDGRSDGNLLPGKMERLERLEPGRIESPHTSLGDVGAISNKESGIDDLAFPAHLDRRKQAAQ